jgi:hypothetical protein
LIIFTQIISPERRLLMNKEKITVSLEILILNDLLRAKVIDKDIYDKAVQKIESVKATQATNQPMVTAPV